MRRVCSDFDVRKSEAREKNEASKAYGNVRYLGVFSCYPENCRRKNMKMNLVRGTRYVAIGQQNYHIVSQLVRRRRSVCNSS